MIPYDRNYQFDVPLDNFSSRSSSPDDPIETSPMIDEQPALHEAEARDKFRSSPPPFAVKKRGQKKSKQILLATADGRYPDKEYYATAFTRRWDDIHVFWTLEMKTGERYIIKAFSGASRGGCTYRFYTGGEPEFHPVPVAFSVRGTSQDQENDTPPKENQQDGLRLEDGSRKGRSSVPRSTLRSMGLDHTSLLPFLHRRDKDPTGNSGSLQAHDNLPSNSRAPQARYTESIDDEFPDTSPEAPVTRTRPRKRTRPILECEDSDSDELYGVSPRAQKRKSEKSHDPSQPQASLPTISPSGFSQREPRAPSASMPRRSSSNFTLPADKVTRTTLLVSHSLSPDDFIPLSLRSCMTIKTFFTSILDAADIKESDLERVKVSFGWMPGKKLVMKQSLADIFFEEFLRTIDEAPCWDEGKRCKVDVEVFVKKNA